MTRQESDWSMVWYGDTTAEPTLTLTTNAYRTLTDMVADAGETSNKSRIVSEVVADVGGIDDTLRRCEVDLDSALEAEEVPVESLGSPGRLADREEKENVRDKLEGVLPREVYSESTRDKRTELTLPSTVDDLLRDVAPGSRSLGWWLSGAIKLVYEDAFSCRAHRVEAKRQLLAHARGEYVGDELDVVRAIREGHHAAYTDVTIAISDGVALHEREMIDPEEINWNLRQLKKTQSARVGPTTAVARYKLESMPSGLIRGQVQSFVQLLNCGESPLDEGEYKRYGETETEIINKVLDTLRDEYHVVGDVVYPSVDAVPDDANKRAKKKIWDEMVEIVPSGSIGAQNAINNVGQWTPDWEEASIERLQDARAYLREKVR